MSITSGNFVPHSYAYGNKTVLPKPKIVGGSSNNTNTQTTSTTPVESQTELKTEVKTDARSDSKEINETLLHESDKSSEIKSKASSTTNNDTMQDAVIHKNTSGSNTQKIKKPPAVRRKTNGQKIQIRDFPRDVMTLLKEMFPGQHSYVETLLAYIYVTSPTKFDIPSSVRDMVDTYESDNEFAQILKQIKLLRQQVKNLEVTTYQTAIASEYALFTDLGLRKDTSVNPRDIDYLEPGVEDMHIALEDKAKTLKRKDINRQHR